MVYLQESEFNIEAENDPEIFSQAMRSMESNLRYDAMEEEMNSITFNEVRDLVELLDGNVERHKVRLVAKRFTQREVIDYTETYSPTSKKDSLRTIMVLVAHFNMDLHQMNVKITFLNS
ncbi:UNVERIFIED_CONTAM: hypothetical protein Sradi_2078000 [Sesamum radiatum]|uniref:Reverse transcriptase Ty1/copia-type domain-containing protein n=1 Tax=Sesamum radiatum TaxID=300843 RepID=A0AAW2TI54_SESRA